MVSNLGDPRCRKPIKGGVDAPDLVPKPRLHASQVQVTPCSLPSVVAAAGCTSALTAARDPHVRRHVADKADLIELESKDSDGLEGKENLEYGSRVHWELVSERLSRSLRSCIASVRFSNHPQSRPTPPIRRLLLVVALPSPTKRAREPTKSPWRSQWPLLPLPRAIHASTQRLPTQVETRRGRRQQHKRSTI